MVFQTLESRARESNISESDLYDYIDMMKTKVRDRSSSSDSVESLTWEHFCKFALHFLTTVSTSNSFRAQLTLTSSRGVFPGE